MILNDSIDIHKIDLIPKKEFSKNREVGFKFDKSYYVEKYFSNKKSDTIFPFIKEKYKNLLTIYSKDSIKINGSNKNHIINNFVSEDRPKLHKEYKVLNIIDNLLFIDINGYEWWECVMVNLSTRKIDILPQLPLFLDKENMIIFNHYYGDDEFYYLNIKNGINFGFVLNQMEFKDYYLFKNIIYFKVSDIKKEEIKYLKVNLNDLTKNK